MESQATCPNEFPERRPLSEGSVLNRFLDSENAAAAKMTQRSMRNWLASLLGESRPTLAQVKRAALENLPANSCRTDLLSVRHCLRRTTSPSYRY